MLMFGFCAVFKCLNVHDFFFEFDHIGFFEIVASRCVFSHFNYLYVSVVVFVGVALVLDSSVRPSARSSVYSPLQKSHAVVWARCKD